MTSAAQHSSVTCCSYEFSRHQARVGHRKISLRQTLSSQSRNVKRRKKARTTLILVTNTATVSPYYTAVYAHRRRLATINVSLLIMLAAMNKTTMIAMISVSATRVMTRHRSCAHAARCAVLRAPNPQPVAPQSCSQSFRLLARSCAGLARHCLATCKALPCGMLLANPCHVAQ